MVSRLLLRLCTGYFLSEEDLNAGDLLIRCVYTSSSSRTKLQSCFSLCLCSWDSWPGVFGVTVMLKVKRIQPDGSLRDLVHWSYSRALVLINIHMCCHVMVTFSHVKESLSFDRDSQSSMTATAKESEIRQMLFTCSHAKPTDVKEHSGHMLNSIRQIGEVDSRYSKTESPATPHDSTEACASKACASFY